MIEIFELTKMKIMYIYYVNEIKITYKLYSY